MLFNSFDVRLNFEVFFSVFSVVSIFEEKTLYFPNWELDFLKHYNSSDKRGQWGKGKIYCQKILLSVGK